MEELIYASATALARAIRDKQVSSTEVVEAHLRRIEEVNPSLNAVVLVTADVAREQAREADRALAGGDPVGPLHGVPVTIKDALETEGVISTGGTLGRAEYVPDRDATVVARLKAAGAIVLGKTNLPEFSFAFESDNLVYGRCNNPYDLTRTPGGSTGGESAIIAAGGSPLGLGSDAGGSIRVPCHFCGIAGIKPTSGRVPRTGHWPRFEGQSDSFTQVGPMARFVEDLALALPIISGPDGQDPFIVPVDLLEPDAVDIGSLRVAFFTDNGVVAADAATADVVRSAAMALGEAGVAVDEATPPAIGQAQEIITTLFTADGGAGIRDTMAAAGTTEAHPLIQRGLERQGDAPIGADEFARALVRLDRFRGEMLSFMETYDAIVCPTCAYPAMRHGTTFDEELFPAFLYTETFNATGWPAAVVRGGTSPEGLPIGVQVAARPWREDVALALARRVEEALGGWQPPPL